MENIRHDRHWPPNQRTASEMSKKSRSARQLKVTCSIYVWDDTANGDQWGVYDNSDLRLRISSTFLCTSTHPLYFDDNFAKPYFDFFGQTLLLKNFSSTKTVLGPVLLAQKQIRQKQIRQNF